MQRLVAVRVEVDDRLVRIDLSHFMSWDLVSLCDGASVLEPSAPKRALVRDALDFLI